MIASGKKLFRAIPFILAILLCLSIIAPMASARGSMYIDDYSADMTAGSNGSVTVSFHIVGIGKMDEIGVTTIILYENGTTVKTFSYTTTSGMMAYNANYHGGSVAYAGTVGKTYSAYVSFKAGKNGGSDSRGMNTNSVTAKK